MFGIALALSRLAVPMQSRELGRELVWWSLGSGAKKFGFKFVRLIRQSVSISFRSHARRLGARLASEHGPYTASAC